MAEHIFTLPVPPSFNNAFNRRADGKGRYAVKEYSAWKKRASQELWVQKTGAVGKNYYVHISCGLNHQSDIDNRIKPILDALVEAKVTPDDKWCDQVSIARNKEHDAKTVTVSVWGPPA